MSADEVSAYLETAPEPQRSTLAAVRAIIAGLLPDAEQGIAYGVPAFRVHGKAVAGFAFYKDHCSYFPMSGSITAELADDLADFATSKGSIRFAKDEPLPAHLIRSLIAARQAEIARSAR